MWPFKKKKQVPALPPIDTSAEMDKLIRERLINMISFQGFIHEPAINGVLDCINIKGQLYPQHPTVVKLRKDLLELVSSRIIVDTTKPYIRAVLLLNPYDLHWYTAQKNRGEEPQPV